MDYHLILSDPLDFTNIGTIALSQLTNIRTLHKTFCFVQISTNWLIIARDSYLKEPQKPTTTKVHWTRRNSSIVARMSKLSASVKCNWFVDWLTERVDWKVCVWVGECVKCWKCTCRAKGRRVNYRSHVTQRGSWSSASEEKNRHFHYK